mmetsp:Transcript_13542/g.19831  ORF Transcript_13542/g.19831 Transcript_13542/m.19831 type:complete len:408 (-) Transcript_13542:499-1722(-)
MSLRSSPRSMSSDDRNEFLPLNGELNAQNAPSKMRCLMGPPQIVALIIAGIMMGYSLSELGASSTSTPIASSSSSGTSLKTYNGWNPYSTAESKPVPKRDPSLGPGIAWLMSFPNSGTSYTLKFVRWATQKNAGSNYGEEGLYDGVSSPIFENSPQGPFWIGTEDKFEHPTSGYILTKTHCGMRCGQCSADVYTETPHMFHHRCLSGNRVFQDDKGKLVHDETEYGVELVDKIVHIFRDPFDNAVARFHLNNKRAKKRHEKDTDIVRESTQEGFLDYCKQTDDLFRKEDQKSRFMEDHIYEMIKDVPCYKDFIRYVLWHNAAFTTAMNMEVPVLILHYENYDSRFNETTKELLEFLEQDMVGEIPEFITGKKYRSYYTEEQVKKVKDVMEELAYVKTWGEIKHYFDD